MQQEWNVLLQRFRAGERAAFDALYQQLSGPVYAIAYRILGSREGAEDVTQEVFLRLYRDPPQADNSRAFILRMARNLALDGRRKPVSVPLAEWVEDRGPAPGEAVEVEEALLSLPEAEREIITLHLHAGLKFREIASLLERPLGTVLWRYNKGLSTLRQVLGGGETE